MTQTLSGVSTFTSTGVKQENKKSKGAPGWNRDLYSVFLPCQPLYDWITSPLWRWYIRPPVPKTSLSKVNNYINILTTKETFWQGDGEATYCVKLHPCYTKQKKVTEGLTRSRHKLVQVRSLNCYRHPHWYRLSSQVPRPKSYSTLSDFSSSPSFV